MSHRLKILCLFLGVLAWSPSPKPIFAAPKKAAGQSNPSAEQVKFFESQVRPLLATRCVKCHDEKKRSGGLRLDSVANLLRGGDSGPAVVPGKPDESLLVEAIRHESLEMPPENKLSEKEIAALVRWVKLGVPWPKNQIVRAVEKRISITDEDRAFWSFQPVKSTVVPRVNDAGWSRNAIDKFVFRRLQKNGLTPADEANKRALIRRLSFDLTGLPPSPAALDEFLADNSPRAYDKLVDRLLKSPRYGERWARHWLDLVRYAESDGFRADGFRSDAWRYRDYVIKSFNDDKPYDRFVLEQLAGDEIAPNDPAVLDATMFLRHGIYEWNQRDARTQWSDILNEITDVTADVFLGLGLSCARCHDHKFDPLLQDDYFRLQAFFTPLLPRYPGNEFVVASQEQLGEHSRKLAAWRKKTAAIRSAIDAIEQPLLKPAAEAAIIMFPPDVEAMIRKPKGKRTPFEHQLAELSWRQVRIAIDKVDLEKKLTGEKKERWQTLRKQLAEFDSQKPKSLPRRSFLVSDVGSTSSPTTVPGDSEQRSIPPGFPTVMAPGPASIVPVPTAPNSTGRRTALARWITDPKNPLTTRVIVNRVWQYHFGRGLVTTASDFGRLGTPPSHPELLDWLMRRFVEGGWSIKTLHRLIVTSATYRQSALRDMPAIAAKTDQGNTLLWKMNSHRLAAEQIRDAALAVSGELNPKQGGSSDQPASSLRRTIYSRVLRNSRDPLLDAFDAPDALSSTPERNSTTTATQSLLMINGPWMLKRAEAFARRIEKSASESASQIDLAYRLAFGRLPSDRERILARAFLDSQRDQIQTSIVPTESKTKLAVGRIPKRNSDALALTGDAKSTLPTVPFHASLPAGDFTIEAVIFLKSLYPDATVRTIASHWNNNSKQPGWSFGVTSTKSGYQPRNLILQLVGADSAGKTSYEVVASNLRPELNTPYYVAASVKIAETGKAGITFYLKDLSKNEAPLRTAAVAHRVVKGYRPKLPLLLGGRHGQPRHRWHGLLDNVRLTGRAIPQDELLVTREKPTAKIVGFWMFDNTVEIGRDTSGNGLQLVSGTKKATDPRTAALVDFCHVLLNSNEFLYVE